MAGAPKENTNAEKWTIEEAHNFCNEVLSILSKNESIRTLGGACLKAGGYEQLINYLESKFSIDFVSIKRAKEIVKERLIEQGLENEVNSTMAIFILKNNHDMKDRIDTTTLGEKITDRPISSWVDGTKDGEEDMENFKED